MAARSDLEFVKGETWKFRVTVADENGVTITDPVLAAQFIVGKPTTRGRINLSLGDGIEVTGTPGIYAMTVTGADQTLLNSGGYPYQFWVTLSDGTDSMQVSGRLLLLDSLK